MIPPERAFADGSGDVMVKISGPLDSTACSATPPTISVFGLNIDVSTATFDSEDDEAGGCASLVPGSNVEVSLASDSVPLEATKVSQGEDDDEDKARIQAPLQAVDTTAKTITVLGLTIDASNATLEGEDDQGGQPIDLSQIVVGQILEIQLDSSQLPALVATEIEIKNFTNQVSVTLDDDQGQEVDDGSDDVSVDVTETVLVKQNIAGKAARTLKQTIHLQFQTHGSFVLTGLPKGNAKVNVVRTFNGVQTAARRAVHVAPNKNTLVKLRLHRTHS